MLNMLTDIIFIANLYTTLWVHFSIKDIDFCTKLSDILPNISVKYFVKYMPFFIRSKIYALLSLYLGKWFISFKTTTKLNSFVDSCLQPFLKHITRPFFFFLFESATVGSLNQLYITLIAYCSYALFCQIVLLGLIYWVYTIFLGCVTLPLQLLSACKKGWGRMLGALGMTI